MSWNFMKFYEILFQTDAESFSFLSWKTKKFYFKRKEKKKKAVVSKYAKIDTKDGVSGKVLILSSC